MKMEKEAFEKLIADKPTSVRIKGVALFTALKEAEGLCLSEPSDNNRSKLNLAESALQEFVALVGDESSFPNLAQILSYLKEEGWNVSKTSLHRHFEQGRFVASDGMFLRKDIDRYAKTWLKQKSTGKPANEAMSELQRKKAELELDNLILDNKKKKMAVDKEQGLFIPREQLEIELASWTGILEAGLKHWIQSNAAGWIRITDGDTKKVGELINAMNADLDEMINSYSSDREYEVIFDSPSEEETD